MPDLDFDHEATENGGSTWPETHTIKGVHPDSGEQVGFLKYRTPRRAKDKIKIDRLEVHPEHQGNGFGSQMMDHLQERHPKTPIDHGDRTDDGKAWWASYTRGKSVQKGRTVARAQKQTSSVLWARTAVEGQAYYHGTTVPDVTHILPADQHGGHVTFPHDTSPSHAYATTNEDDAWDYAEKAFHAADRGHPRVYRVEPMGHVEKDPEEDEHGNWRNGVNRGDVRSPHGFKVLHEVPMPEHLGTPEDWR